jgi:hypothetical protein
VIAAVLPVGANDLAYLVTRLLQERAADLGQQLPDYFDLRKALNLAEDFLWERGQPVGRHPAAALR